MNNDRASTVKSRTLTAALVRAMRNKGWNATKLGAVMGWSLSKTSRFLSGKRGTNILDVATVLGQLEVTGTDRDGILALAANMYDPSWWHEHGERLPARLPVLCEQEEAAAAITAFHPTLVPPLLQTKEYRRALLQAGPAAEDVQADIDEYILHLQARQGILSGDNPPTLRFFVDSRALTHPGLAPEIVSDQVHHLLRLSVQPHVLIRVLPDGCGPLPGYPPFELLTFADHKPVVYLELLNTTGFLEHPDTVQAFTRTLAHLRAMALTEDGSRAWLNTLAATVSELAALSEAG
jgi:hypothetical protein